MEGGGDVMPLDLYEHMVTEDASGGASPGVSSTSNQAFLMDNWVHQLYEQVLFLTLPPSPTLYHPHLHISPCNFATYLCLLPSPTPCCLPCTSSQHSIHVSPCHLIIQTSPCRPR